jgi:hypothetical protein
MKLQDVWDLLEEHAKICGTHKLLVETVDGKEGWIPMVGTDMDYPVDVDLDVEVKNVYCPYCCRLIYP